MTGPHKGAIPTSEPASASSTYNSPAFPDERQLSYSLFSSFLVPTSFSNLENTLSAAEEESQKSRKVHRVVVAKKLNLHPLASGAKRNKFAAPVLLIGSGGSRLGLLLGFSESPSG